MTPTDEIERAAWLADRLGTWGTVGGVAGTGFDSYARILHPAHVAGAGTVSDRWTWQDIATRTRRVVHPLAQWDHIGGQEEIIFQEPDRVVRVSHPRTGRLAPNLLATLVPVLAAATTSTESITAAVWNGWGDAGLLASSTVHLPGRDYVLRSGTLSELLDPEWPLDAQLGWQDWYEGAMPQLIWPTNHAWVLASEIDWDSTVVAGSRRLVKAVLDLTALESFPVEPGDSLMSDSDQVNAPVATSDGTTINEKQR